MSEPVRTLTKFDAGVVALAAGPRQAAFGLGNGKIRLVDIENPEAPALEVAAHKGAVLSLAAIGENFISGGDDGRVIEIGPEGGTIEKARHPHRWIEQVAAIPGGYAYAMGKDVLLSTGRTLGPHPSTVAGFHVQGTKLAVAHYGGATLWDLVSEDEPVKLTWKGSHLVVSISPDGRHVATSMQEGEIHAWAIEPRRDMRMSGYPTKVRSISWSGDARLLATSGAEQMVAWPFDGAGPEGRAPEVLAESRVLCTRAACNPRLPMVAGGWEDGTITLNDLGSRTLGKIPLSKRAPVTALGWSADGAVLVAGAEDGRAAVFVSPAAREA